MLFFFLLRCVGYFLELNVNTFCGNLEFTTLDNLDGGKGLVTGGGLEVLDLVDNVVALEDLAEDDVTSVQPPKQLAMNLELKRGGMLTK